MKESYKCISKMVTHSLWLTDMFTCGMHVQKIIAMSTAKDLVGVFMIIKRASVPMSIFDRLRNSVVMTKKP